MRKTLRLSFVMILLCSLCSKVNAQTTFNFPDLYGKATLGDISSSPKTVDGITVSFAKGNSSTAPAYNRAGEIRLYGGKSVTVLDGCTMTFTSGGQNMAKIVLTCGTIGTIGELTANVGSLTEDGEHNITWIGDAKEVIFTANRVSTSASQSTQNRYKQADVTVKDDGSSLSPAELSFSASSYTAFLDGENTLPTFNNPNNLPVTFSSSDENVATIDANGNVTILAKGTTTISATSEETDSYYAGSTSYVLTVKPQPVEVNTPETAFTVAEALAQIENETASQENVYVKGIISQIDEVNAQYGNATYFISDDGTTTNQLEVYRGKYLGGEKFTDESQIKVGDKIIVYGKLVNYNGTYEFTSNSSIYSLNNVTTGISFISTNNKKDFRVYNISGQEVGKNAKGLVIKNGKKVLVK